MNDPLRYLKSSLVALSLALPLQAQAPRASADSTFLSRNGATEARLGTLKVRSSVDPPSFSVIDLGNVATTEMQQRQHNRGRNALIGAVIGGSTVGGLIYYDCSRKTD